MISIKHISKTYNHGKTFIIKDISLTINEGELVILLGSSGCGKTTTLKMINRLTEPSSGDIEVDGKSIFDENITDLRRSIGYVFQGIGLFPHMNLIENISIGLKLAGASENTQKTRAKELLSLINLPAEKFGHRYPDELSGGQRQRVGVARALATKPKYLLMDEPFGALDQISRIELQDELLKLKEQLGITIVFVTHDILEAMKLADRIAIINQGELQQFDTVQNIIQHPANDFVKNLFESHAMQVEELFEKRET